MKIQISLSSLKKPQQIAATHLSFGDKFILDRDHYVVVSKETTAKKVKFKITRLSDNNPMIWTLPTYSHRYVTLVSKYQDLKKEDIERVQKPFNALADREQQKVKDKLAHINKLGVQEGDIVLVRWFHGTPCPEVVMRIKTDGKVAIRPRSTDFVKGKPKLINSSIITRVVQKGPGHYDDSNPMYYKQ